MENKLFHQISEKYPFLSIIHYANTEYIGIIMNQDKILTTMYNFNDIKTIELKQLFLELGETWWWESNRSIPINLFLKEEWTVFKNQRLIFNNKNIIILSGPCTSLNDIAQKRSKRKSITLVRDLDE
jgi:hypothetical protein